MSLLPLAVGSLIDDCNVGPINVTRRVAKLQNEFGEFVADPSPTVVVFDPIAIHNASGRDLLEVPEADRTAEMIQIYTKVRLFVQDGGFDADVIAYRGRNWRFVKVLDYELQGNVYIGLAALEETAQGAHP